MQDVASTANRQRSLTSTFTDAPIDHRFDSVALAIKVRRLAEWLEAEDHVTEPERVTPARRSCHDCRSVIYHGCEHP